jgi:hypothetical protein
MSKEKKKLDDYTATMIAEGVIEITHHEDYIEAWQHLIDTGLAWRLQGWFGRAAHRMIEEGHCKPPPTKGE